MELLDLPDCMLEQILEQLSYDEISKQRVICRKFNEISQGLLNVGFNKMMRRHSNLLKAIKSQLPRRESERRNHPLSKHSDILTCIETRMSMLSMTYTKYIEVNLCCFIPGKVIDEVLHVLNIISSSDMSNGAARTKSVFCEKPLRTHEILQELRDISSMAIDHFEEKIAPTLKKAYCELPTRSILSTSSIQFQYTPDASLSTSGLSLPAFFNHLQQGDSTSTSSPSVSVEKVAANRSDYARLDRKFKKAMMKLNNVIGIQNRQSQKLRNCYIQINELNAQVVDLRRRLEETTSSKKSLEQMAAVVNDTGVPLPPSGNIKPRTAKIILKRVAESSIESLLSKKSKQ